MVHDYQSLLWPLHVQAVVLAEPQVCCQATDQISASHQEERTST